MYIREAMYQDLDKLAPLMTQLAGEEISTNVLQNRLDFIENSSIDWLFVCEEEEEILGLMAFRIRENVESVSRFGEISAIVVDQKARRKGVGKFLMDYAESFADEKGCIGTWLVSGFGREEQAHEFYKALGYEITGYRFRKFE